jgi:endogenous inhibitor of DNA gyrase (YacG/DUF329 family)
LCEKEVKRKEEQETSKEEAHKRLSGLSKWSPPERGANECPECGSKALEKISSKFLLVCSGACSIKNKVGSKNQE